MDYLTKLTQGESDFIAHILDWSDEEKFAFRFAKKKFEEGDEFE